MLSANGEFLSYTYLSCRNYRPTESDLEDEDEDGEDEDPLFWLQEEQDEIMRNPNVVDPDIPDEMSPEELSHIIRVDESRIDYGQFRFDP
jgi:hypothetical protein